MPDPFTWWRKAIAGEKPPVHDDAECGYFKVRDRRGLNKKKAPIKRPWVACAIWPAGDGMKAELAGQPVELDRIWPYCARFPIPYETYAYWHHNERWPEKETTS